MINWFPWASLWPLGLALGAYLFFKYGVSVVVAVIKYIWGGSFVFLLALLPLVSRADEAPVICVTPSIALGNEWFAFMGWFESCASEGAWCLTENVHVTYCSDLGSHETFLLPSCSCAHVYTTGLDCTFCSGVFVHSEIEPPDVGVLPLIVGFGSGFGVIGALFVVRLLWRSLNTGLDVYDRD